MKYINGRIIIEKILDSYDEYEVLPNESKQLILRILDDLKYDRKILKNTIEHNKKYFNHLFE